MLSKAMDFVKRDVWRIRAVDLPFKKYVLLKQLRIILLAIRGFDEDKCLLRASALTFYTLLSIVPVAAMGFGIAKGFGFEKRLEVQLLEQFPAQHEVVTQVIGFARKLLDNTKGGMIAGVGIILLFWSGIKVMGQIEASFNEIWDIKEPRSLGRKFSDYISIMLISPLLLLTSSSAAVFVATHVTAITNKIDLLGIFSPVILFAVELTPYFLIWLLFAIIYILMPNTKVNFRSGLLAGVVAGTIYALVQIGYIKFQVGVAKYNAIYGSFAALPLFLVWLQISWLIVLFGAEIAFADQNVDTYEFEPDSGRVSKAFKTLLSLQVVHLVVKHFSKGDKALTAAEISHALEIPIRLVHEILYDLVEAGVLSRVVDKSERAPAYQPAKDIDKITIQWVMEALEQKGIDTIPVAKTEELAALSEALETFKTTIETSPENRRLKDI
jgi:membrane protein